MTPVEGSTLTTVATVMVAYLGVLLFIGWKASTKTHGGEQDQRVGHSGRGRPGSHRPRARKAAG